MHIFSEPPPNFCASVEVAGCYCTYLDKVLFLKRNPDKLQGSTWGVPAGKLELGEDPLTAVIREVQEEIGLDIDEHDLREIGRLYVQLPHVDYVFHMFYKPFAKMPHIDLNLEEHTEAKWITIAEAQKLPLIQGGKEALQHYQKFLQK